MRAPPSPTAAARAGSSAPLVAPLVALAFAAAAWSAAPALATNTGDKPRMRVTLFDGTVHEGEVKFTKDRLEVKGRRAVKLRYRDVASLADVPPPDEAELAERRVEHARRAERLGEGDAPGWTRLGQWARDQELEDEAREAFERAVALDPDHAPARRGLGQLQDDGAWVDGAEVLRRRRGELEAGDLDAVVDLARFALRHGLDEQAFGLVRQALNRDTYHAQAIELSRPFTAAYRQRVPMSLPLRGRWKASEDPTRHHQRKGWAVYALDIVKVDASGRSHRGRGDKLEDYLTWDEPFYAVAAGRVAEVRDGNPDNPARTVPPGVAEKHNGVTIDHGNGEVSWYVHARNGSIVVKEGDQVERGQLLGRIGNSGASAVPHLHFTLVAHGNLSVPWACDDYVFIAPDSTPIPVTRACPREGWTFEGKE
ncbi:MAG: peptidoglycan DD-metalloendopeptidase family protein [Planctomycetes bacterium]|nr:peptidoglycan DD-metalloendopeptidase family protein [Planctomycetota bacterium]